MGTLKQSFLARIPTRLSHVMHLRLGLDVWAELQDAAHEHDSTPSALVRHAICEWLSRNRQPRKAQKAAAAR